MSKTSQPPVPPDLSARRAPLNSNSNAQRSAETEAVYRQFLELRPDLADVHINLAAALMDQKKFDEAVAEYQRAIDLNPGLFQAHNSLGCIFQEQGHLERALASYRRALAINPNFPDAHNNLGNALKDEGKFDEARASYDQALALRPDFAEVHYNRKDLKTFHVGDPDLAAMEAIAADPARLPAGKMLFLHFALGKALEDTGDYGRAFEHLLQGNALKRREVNYNEAAYQQTFRQIVDLFDAQRLERFQAMGDPSPVPIFIVGMPRCGTTLVEQILASHPQVHAAGELKSLNQVVRSVSDSVGRPLPFPQCIEVLDADGLRRLGQAYLASLPPLADGTTRMTNKMPTNFAFVGLIRLILPNARIIHVVRDPVDTCVSCFSTLFTSGHTFTYDLAELGCYYRWYHELMDHWRSILPAGAMLDVAYEDIVDNLEQQARQLIDFCGLPWDDRCLNFHENRRPVATASSVQVRRPIYRDSLARWRRYEPYLQPLLAELESCRNADTHQDPL